MHTKFWLENVMERAHLPVCSINERILELCELPQNSIKWRRKLWLLYK